MKIAIDISQIIHEGTGIARYTRNLVDSLLAADRTNEYLLFGYSVRKNHILRDFYNSCRRQYANVNAKIFHFPQTAINTLWNNMHTFPLESLIGKVDVFHSSDWIQPPSFAKKITTVHDMIAFKYPHFSHPTIIATQKRRMNWVEKECDAVIADSETTKADIINFTSINEKRIHVVYPGVEKKFKKIQEKNILQVKSKYKIYKQYILTVGTLEPRKNTTSAIDAYNSLRKKMPIENAPMLIVVGKAGWGDNTPHSTGVQYLGFVKDEDLPALYSGAQAFIYPSYYEGFGLPVLEAMACQCPVISSDRGSLSEIAAGSALIIDPKDGESIVKALVKILSDRNIRNKLILKGNEKAAEFNWKNTAKQILSVYKKLCL